MESTEQGMLSFSLSVVLTGIMLILAITWHILSARIGSPDSSPNLKGFTVLIYIRLILSLLTIYFVYLSMKTFNPDNFADNLTKIYVETIILTLNAVLQTLVWFNILIMSLGWQIHRGIFSRNELRSLVVAFISLYVLICFDQIFDMLINFKFGQVRKINPKIYF
jgi:hypothetical protein